MKVVCIDNTLHRDLLDVGKVYEVYQERDDLYVISGIGYSKKRFEPYVPPPYAPPQSIKPPTEV